MVVFFMHGSSIVCLLQTTMGQARHRSRCWERREEGVQQTRFFPQGPPCISQGEEDKHVHRALVCNAPGEQDYKEKASRDGEEYEGVALNGFRAEGLLRETCRK